MKKGGKGYEGRKNTRYEGKDMEKERQKGGNRVGRRAMKEGRKAGRKAGRKEENHWDKEKKG